MKEAVAQGSSVKKVFLEILQKLLLIIIIQNFKYIY